MNCRLFLAVAISLALASQTAISAAEQHCPRPDQLQRVPGEYSWYATIPGWEGFYAYPQSAKGYSNHLVRFIETRWIQFTNLPSSPGYVQCDYEGDLGHEVIRFALKDKQATKRPESEYWTHLDNIEFPSVQRTCSVSLELCLFEPLDSPRSTKN